jgi:hypothetical protein
MRIRMLRVAVVARWIDIAMLLWPHLSFQNIKNLKFLSVGIINEKTEVN